MKKSKAIQDKAEITAFMLIKILATRDRNERLATNIIAHTISKFIWHRLGYQSLAEFFRKEEILEEPIIDDVCHFAKLYGVPVTVGEINDLLSSASNENCRH